MTKNMPLLKAHKTLFIALFVAAFLVRATIFYWYIKPNTYYNQADSNDYHVGALCINYGYGMTRPDTGEPQFWRTPGYPLYLVPFYKLYAPTGTLFADAAPAQQASIWFQLLLSSLIPIALFFLALLLTGHLAIAYITAWISVFHLGLVLTSTYLLTEGIALLPFYLFLLFFYRSLWDFTSERRSKRHWAIDIALAALMLALYTWTRPMGQYVAVIAIGLILFFGEDDWKGKAKKCALFAFLFLLLISPWYIRNYRLTGQWFFCPMFGAYLNSFCAPRIVSSLNNMDLIESWKQLCSAAEIEYRQLKPTYQRIGIHLPKEFVCGQIAWPIFLAHPWLALYDWMREVFKTTFDLYSGQLVAFQQGCYFYDPIIEYLSDKVADCLYKTPMPWFMRLAVYLELIYAILLWIGLFGGCWQFLIAPIIKKLHVDKQTKYLFWLWITLAPMIGAVVFMTGGFGYARLRLPIEPLMVILSLTFWYWVYEYRSK